MTWVAKATPPLGPPGSVAVRAEAPPSRVRVRSRRTVASAFMRRRSFRFEFESLAASGFRCGFRCESRFAPRFWSRFWFRAAFPFQLQFRSRFLFQFHFGVE